MLYISSSILLANMGMYKIGIIESNSSFDEEGLVIFKRFAAENSSAAWIEITGMLDPLRNADGFFICPFDMLVDACDAILTCDGETKNTIIKNTISCVHKLMEDPHSVTWTNGIS